jgi:hypothetical protein
VKISVFLFIETFNYVSFLVESRLKMFATDGSQGYPDDRSWIFIYMYVYMYARRSRMFDTKVTKEKMKNQGIRDQ